MILLRRIVFKLRTVWLVKLRRTCLNLAPALLQVILRGPFRPVHLFPLFKSNLLQSVLDIKAEIDLLINAILVFYLFFELSCNLLCVSCHILQALE